MSRDPYTGRRIVGPPPLCTMVRRPAQAPALEPIPHVAGQAPTAWPASETRPFVLEAAPLYCATGRPLRVQLRPGRRAE